MSNMFDIITMASPRDNLCHQPTIDSACVHLTKELSNLPLFVVWLGRGMGGGSVSVRERVGGSLHTV